jgi:hypothetical protein
MEREFWNVLIKAIQVEVHIDSKKMKQFAT